MSSRQISMPIRDDLPPAARPPVAGMLMPILIGCWAMAVDVQIGAASSSPRAARILLRFTISSTVLLSWLFFACFPLLYVVGALAAEQRAEQALLGGLRLRVIVGLGLDDRRWVRAHPAR